jgi:hypothetical protein
MTTKMHTGSCHCGAVRFEVDTDLAQVTRCNCSICTKTAITGTQVKPAQFRLLAGEAQLGAYEFGHRVAKRYFCTTCGVHCFGKGHLEVLGGDFVSINVNTLDDVELGELRPLYWDGRHDNWAAGARDTPYPIGA